MFKIYSEGVLYFRGFDYEKIKLREAYCRGNRLDYEITYPDGSILQCKFKTNSMSKQPHNLKKGQTKHFANLGALQEFCDTYEYSENEFKVTYKNGVLIEKL